MTPRDPVTALPPGLAAANAPLQDRIAELEAQLRRRAAELDDVDVLRNRNCALTEKNDALAARVGELAGVLQDYAATFNEDTGHACDHEAGGVWFDITYGPLQELPERAESALAPDAAQRALARLRAAEGLAQALRKRREGHGLLTSLELAALAAWEAP